MKHVTDWKNHTTMTRKMNRTEKEFILQEYCYNNNNGQRINNKKILTITKTHQVVNKNEKQFLGKVTREAKNRGIRKNLSIT